MKVVICRTMLRPRLIEVVSSKGDGTTYTAIPSTIWNDAICDCKGYQFRGYCRHSEEVDEARCKNVRPWNGEVDSDGDGDVGRCYCGNPLVIFEMDPEFE